MTAFAGGTLPSCQMREGCPNRITHIGEKGYVYCAEHAPRRRGIERTRKMRTWELTMLAQGKPLPSYEPKPKPTEEVTMPSTTTEYERDPRLAAFIDSQIEARPLEAELVKKLIAGFAADGKPIVSFFDGEEEGTCTSEQEILDIVFNLDEVRLYSGGGHMVFLVMGQFPDTITDYTVGIESIIDPVQAWAERHG